MQERDEEVFEEPEAGSERLSVFEDFFESMSSDPDEEDDDEDETD